jgi:hypothetical protein
MRVSSAYRRLPGPRSKRPFHEMLDQQGLRAFIDAYSDPNIGLFHLSRMEFSTIHGPRVVSENTVAKAAKALGLGPKPSVLRGQRGEQPTPVMADKPEREWQLLMCGFAREEADAQLATEERLRDMHRRRTGRAPTIAEFDAMLRALLIDEALGRGRRAA